MHTFCSSKFIGLKEKKIWKNINKNPYFSIAEYFFHFYVKKEIYGHIYLFHFILLYNNGTK